MALNPEIKSFIQRSFINTADENYLLARLAFFRGLNLDFYWLSVHCLEKYFKACLLFNGISAKNYSHDLLSLEAASREIIGDLIPVTLDLPAQLPVDGFDKAKSFTFAEGVEAFFRNGEANNRYLYGGYVRYDYDIHRLDLLVFYLRRVCTDLAGESVVRDTEREFRRDFPNYWTICSSSPLEKLASGKSGVLRDDFLRGNFVFRQALREEPPSEAGCGFGFVNSAFGMITPQFEDAIKRGYVSDSVREVALWMMSSIHLSKEDKNYLSEVVGAKNS